MPEPNSLLVLGIDPGPTRPAALAAWTVLSLDAASGTVGVLRQPVHLSKASLAELLQAEPLLSDPHLRLAAMAAPMTPSLLEREPWKARSVEIRLSRGAFSGVARGPWMPWICSARTWPRYQRTARLQAILQSRGLPILAMPAELQAIDLPSRSLVEVYPKATLALLSSTAPLSDRPAANQFLGELDDWLFPRLFTDLESSTPPIQTVLQDMGLGLRLAPETFLEAQRIVGIRRPFPRREPMRAFIAAFQGLLALRGDTCLVGAPGEYEGSILLPATWHSDWEAEWSDPRRSVSQLRHVPVRSLAVGVAPSPVHASIESEPAVVEQMIAAFAADQRSAMAEPSRIAPPISRTSR